MFNVKLKIRNRTLRTLCALASKHGAILLCGETDSVAKFHVVTRCVDVVPETAVYEALNVRVSNPDNKDEWMYNLDTVLDPVSQAVEACRRRDYKEAEAALGAALPSEAATVWYLACKIQMCLSCIDIPFKNVRCPAPSKSKQQEEEQEDPAAKAKQKEQEQEDPAAKQKEQEQEDPAAKT